MPALNLTITAKTGSEHRSFLRTKLMKAHALIKSTVQELSIAVVGSKRMAELHEQFMDIAGPTDVLTFPLELDAKRRVIGGEVVICLPIARQRAREAGVKLRDELLLYALHGMLHLNGWDDRTQREYHRMHSMEDKILRQLGIGPVFSASSGRKDKP